MYFLLWFSIIVEVLLLLRRLRSYLSSNFPNCITV